MSFAAASVLAVSEAASIPIHGVPGTNQERSFIAIKPDGTQRKLVGDIISRFEAKGYKLVGIKILVPSQDLAKKHYADLAQKPFFPGMIAFFTSGPVVAMVWEGHDVIAGGRRLLGATHPKDSAPGTSKFCDFFFFLFVLTFFIS